MGSQRLRQRAESTVAKALSPAVRYAKGSVQSSEGDRREGQTVSILSPYPGAQVAKQQQIHRTV